MIKDLQSILASLSPLDNPALIAIDGRPCSGKTTLACALAETLEAETYYLDEFLIPRNQWSKNIQPCFPFPYFRYDEFVLGIETLAAGKSFQYLPYDFETGELSGVKKEIVPAKKPIIIEGVSVLQSRLLRNYLKRIFVVSDPASERASIFQREGVKSKDLWENLYLPSVDLYFKTRPWEQADIIYLGRGISSEEKAENVLRLSKKPESGKIKA